MTKSPFDGRGWLHALEGAQAEELKAGFQDKEGAGAEAEAARTYGGVVHGDLVGGVESGEIIGQQVSILVNLAPRKIKGIESQGMILMAENNKGELSFVAPTKADMNNGGSVK